MVNCGIDVIDFPLCDLGIFIAVRTNLNWPVRCVAHQLITLTLLFSGLSGVTCVYGAVDWAHALSALVDHLGVGAGAAAAAILLHHTISVGWCQRRRSWCRQTSQRTERFGSGTWRKSWLRISLELRLLCVRARCSCLYLAAFAFIGSMDNEKNFTSERTHHYSSAHYAAKEKEARSMRFKWWL